MMSKILQLLFVAVTSATVSRLMGEFMPVQLPTDLVVLVFALTGFAVTGLLHHRSASNPEDGGETRRTALRRKEVLEQYSVTAFTAIVFWLLIGVIVVSGIGLIVKLAQWLFP